MDANSFVNTPTTCKCHNNFTTRFVITSIIPINFTKSLKAVIWMSPSDVIFDEDVSEYKIWQYKYEGVMRKQKMSAFIKVNWIEKAVNKVKVNYAKPICLSLDLIGFRVYLKFQ